MLRTLLLGLYLFVASHKPFVSIAPQSAMINGEKWAIVEQTVIWHNDSSDWLGWTNCRDRNITVLRLIPRNQKSVVIVHEIEHAMTCENGEVHNERFNNPTNGDHSGIYWSSKQWQRFIVDNPDLVKWVAESGKY